RDRNRSERERAPEVRHHEDRPARQPVDPDPGRQAEEQERKEVDRSKRRDLERRRVQRQDGDERQRDARDLRAELTDALSRPELQKIGMPPQAAVRPDPYAGHYCARAGAAARTTFTSPLTVLILSSTIGPSSALSAIGSSPGVSLSSSSELVEPLTVFAST